MRVLDINKIYILVATFLPSPIYTFLFCNFRFTFIATGVSGASRRSRATFGPRYSVALSLAAGERFPPRLGPAMTDARVDYRFRSLARATASA